MSADPKSPEWPALDWEQAEPPRQLDFVRGVWGKVHGAPTDYRWIASGPGFGPGAELENEISLGREDRPAAGQAWRSLDDEALAVGFYPSRTRDAAGRSGFVEKQVLLWRRPPQVPAAVGALLLLPLAARSSDEIWWGRRDEPRLHDPDFRLDLPPETDPPAPVDLHDLAARAEEARRRLSELVDERSLARLYAGILGGGRALPLELSAPLPAAAVAALLLPLPRHVADRLSIAGWIPSERTASTDLRRCWDVVATDRPGELASASADSSAADRREGARLAAAVHRGLVPFETSRSTSVAVAGPGHGEEYEIALWGPAAAGKTVLLARLYESGASSSGWRIFPTPESHDFGKKMRQLVRLNNRFPTATPTSLTERLVYRFHRPDTAARANLVLEDRAGGLSEQLDDHARRRLSSAHGLVLLFDPQRDATRFQVEIEQTLDEVHIARGGEKLQDDRPIAVCISKADLLIGSADDARFAASEPDQFVRQRVKGVDRLVAALDRFCTNYRLFPVSAAGLRLRWGAIEPTVFYDENLDLRIRGESPPFNLVAPFGWVLDQLAR